MSRRGRGVGAYVGILPFVGLALFPFYHMLLTSLKTNEEIYDLGANPFVVERGVTAAHYLLLFNETLFGRWFANSLLVGVVTAVVSVVLGILAGYALARFRFPGAAICGVGIFVSYLIPPSLLFIPLTIVVNGLGLSDSLVSLMVTYPTFLVPFNTWLLMAYFRTLPKEVEECAMIDGCNRYQTLVRVVLPMTLPGIVCAFLFSFTFSWNEFLYSLVFISQASERTIPVGVVSDLIRGDVFYWGSLMAGAVLGSVPIVLMYVFFMDFYVKGLTAGSVKG